MKHSKILSPVILVLFFFMLAGAGVTVSSSNAWGDFQPQEKKVDQKQEEKREQQPEKKKDDFEDVFEKRMREGESLFKILGIPEPEDYMPTTFDLILLWIIPFSVIVGIVALVIIVSKRRHQRILAMIEKGMVPNKATLKEFKAAPFRWDVFLLLTGLILSLGGFGLSVFMIGHKGIDQWYTGVIPLLVGLALLLFYNIFYKKKKGVTKRAD